ncbi:40418_t:CDS:2 [Gigaspora margarita]|uniref:40418_t:CDS:1 n=1 Tax=Gigaspora margarita TaxID=4874 RepID=A0ABN7VHR4_GIGMA|nr:40418_t:CDS:2 [Gigaspora margarita]
MSNPNSLLIEFAQNVEVIERPPINLLNELRLIFKESTNSFQQIADDFTLESVLGAAMELIKIQKVQLIGIKKQMINVQDQSRT